nr:integrase, catalytic region, zinc finger, CCHC-type, peptidase aspartic, catalytic [Tanacetum cinerariifolium]
MTTLADKAILSGAENRPPMLEKDIYDSWKSRMELYMMNRQHGRMILESIENAPLLWPTIEENGVTKPKKYSELSAAKAIQADCDERIQLLMQGTLLTKQERECKLYDEFDKFAYKKGESLLNTKFLNTLPPEWSEFVTDVKLVRDLHTTSVDQLHAYLGQYEFHANEVRLMHERNSDPLALVVNHQMTQSPYQTHHQSYQHTQFQPQVSSFQSLKYGSHAQSSTPLLITYPSNDFQSSIHHNVYNLSSSIPQVKYAPSGDQQSEFSQPDSGLIVLVFQKGHMSKQCTKPMRKRDEAWFKDKYVNSNNTAYQADDLDAYDSDCDKINSAKIALMVNLTHYGFDNLAEELPKVSMMNSSLKKLKYHLASFDMVVKERTTATAIIEALKDTLRKLKGKAVVNEAVTLYPIDPELLKIDVTPLAPILRYNRTVHYDYLKHTQEETATLRELVENERLLNPHIYVSKDEAPKFIIKFLKMIQVRLNVPVRRIRTDNGTEFVNQTLHEYYKQVGISHEISVARSPRQNGVVERRNRTLIEVARTISGPTLHEMTPATISSGPVPKPTYSTPVVPPSRNEWDLLFQPLFDELLTPPPSVDPSAPKVISPIAEVIPLETAVSTGSPSSTIVDQDAPSPSKSQTTPKTQPPIIPHDVEEDNLDIEVAYMGNDPLFGMPISEVAPDQSSSTDYIHTVVHPDLQISQHNSKWTKDHPLENIIEPKTYKYALTQSCWIEAMQEELNEFERLEVWELVPQPNGYNFEVDIQSKTRRTGRLEAIRIFLAYAAHKNMVVYQMDVKTVFLNVDTPMVEKSKLDEDKEGKAINLSHYHDADHADCQDKRHSISGSLQFLGDRLIS